MISIFLGLLALYVLFSKRVSISKNYEIRRPKTYYWGIIIAVSVLLVELFSKNLDSFSTILYMFLIFIPVISSIFLRQRKEVVDFAEEQENSKRIQNIIAWFILVGLTLFFVGLYFYDIFK